MNLTSSPDRDPAMQGGRTCVLVLGMHRSGTSALTRVISLLGAELPKNILGANSGNEKGHWEPARLMQLHNAMLAEAGSSWDDWRQLDLSAALPAERLDHYRSEIRRLIEEEYGEAPLFVLKEPRICRFVPLYRQVLEQMGVAVRPILMRRNPLDVMASLAARDGLKPAQTQLYWLRHVLDCERHTRDLPRGTAGYEALLEDWRKTVEAAIAPLGTDWPHDPDAIAADVETFLTPELRHHAASLDDIEADETLAHWIERAHRALVDLPRAPKRAMKTLDAITAEFEPVAAVFGPALAAERERLRATNDTLAAEKNAATDRVRSLEAEVAEQSTRIESLAKELEERRLAADTLEADRDRISQELEAAQNDTKRVLSEFRNSMSWRITSPLRTLGQRANQCRFYFSKLRYSLRNFGIFPTIKKIIFFALSRRAKHRTVKLLARGSEESSENLKNFYPQQHLSSTSADLHFRVLLIAELTISQCKKYRVDQKVEALRQLGIDAAVVSWTDTSAARNLLQLYPLAIFYRVPFFDDVEALFQEANRLGVTTFWEVDDLIFDLELYRENRNLDGLPPEELAGLLDGAKLYRSALLASDISIASTPKLAERMQLVTGRPSFVIQNAIDKDTIEAARKALEQKKYVKSSDNKIRIVYGSGTKTHDVDFLEAADAILDLLESRTDFLFVIIGHLKLDERFNKFESRIERIEFSDFSGYLKILASCDIAIAPLFQSVFNDCKSNIKFLEYSSIMLPSVTSPSASFSEAVIDGENGFLAEGRDEWRRKLDTLIDDAELRHKIARRAYESVNEKYGLRQIADSQVGKAFSKFLPKRKPLRILKVNIFFSPQSFGGSTIVAEQLARRISAHEDVDVYVLTSWNNDNAAEGEFVRYSVGPINVVALKLPMPRKKWDLVDDSRLADAFEEVLKAICPDVVHFHSIQGFSASILESCSVRNVPFVVTLHDAWWICERQFMVTGEDRYCFQEVIDLSVCAKCVEDASFNKARDARLRGLLGKADNLLAPSQFFRDLYIKNGFAPDKVIVHKNGVRSPVSVVKQPRKSIVFGYVGGNTPIKGYDLILEAFRHLSANDVELRLVDNTLNLGFSSMAVKADNFDIDVNVVPPYTQDSIDEFFQGIDVLLFPTQWKESFGLTVREALIRDVWVISSDAGGAVEEIVDGENGFVIPISRDYRHLQRAVERTITRFREDRLFVNPYKAHIRSFDEQADELLGILRRYSCPDRERSSAHALTKTDAIA